MPGNVRWNKGSDTPLTSVQEGVGAPKTTGVFILSDVRLHRDGLAGSLSRCDEIDVVGVAAPSEIARSQLIKSNIAVLLLDATIERGLEIVKDLKAAAPRIRIVVVAVNEQERVLLAYAEAGVAGYVTQDGSIDDVIEAVRRCLRDEIPCTPRLTALLFHRVSELSGTVRAADELPLLTQRERDVATLVADGLSNKEIARALRISFATVKNHIHNILEKLRVGRRGEAAARLRYDRRPFEHQQKSPTPPEVSEF
jgi:two-component system nitrate/nitrite response regulator NarL